MSTAEPDGGRHVNSAEPLLEIPEDWDPLGSTPPKRALFVCTHNAVRSRMAAGLLTALFPQRWEADSAGVRPSRGVNPRVVEVLGELGIEIPGGPGKPVSDFATKDVDILVALSDEARDCCALLPVAGRRIDRVFFDPGTVEGSDDEKLDAFVALRDQMLVWIREAFG